MPLLQRAAFMRLSRRVTSPAVYGWVMVRHEFREGAFSLLLVSGFSQLAAAAKAWPMKHAEARSSLVVTGASGRKTAGLVTLRGSPMNRA
jgi:hypothetical protein